VNTSRAVWPHTPASKQLSLVVKQTAYLGTENVGGHQHVLTWHMNRAASELEQLSSNQATMIVYLTSSATVLFLARYLGQLTRVHTAAAPDSEKCSTPTLHEPTPRA
jgi:hypothetical protein